MADKNTALVTIAAGTEEIEAVVVIDVLRRAGVSVTVAAVGSELQVECARGTKLVADVLVESVATDTFDLVYLPGGMPGATHLYEDPHVTELITKQHIAGRLLAAICAAPVVVLYAHGLLEGRHATAYPALAGKLPLQEKVSDSVVVDGHLVTSKGPGTAMELACTLFGTLRNTPTVLLHCATAGQIVHLSGEVASSLSSSSSVIPPHSPPAAAAAAGATATLALRPSVDKEPIATSIQPGRTVLLTMEQEMVQSVQAASQRIHPYAESAFACFECIFFADSKRKLQGHFFREHGEGSLRLRCLGCCQQLTYSSWDTRHRQKCGGYVAVVVKRADNAVGCEGFEEESFRVCDPLTKLSCTRMLVKEKQKALTCLPVELFPFLDDPTRSFNELADQQMVLLARKPKTLGPFRLVIDPATGPSASNFKHADAIRRFFPFERFAEPTVLERRTVALRGRTASSSPWSAMLSSSGTASQPGTSSPLQDEGDDVDSLLRELEDAIGGEGSGEVGAGSAFSISESARGWEFSGDCDMDDWWVADGLPPELEQMDGPMSTSSSHEDAVAINQRRADGRGKVAVTDSVAGDWEAVAHEADRRLSLSRELREDAGSFDESGEEGHVGEEGGRAEEGHEPPSIVAPELRAPVGAVAALLNDLPRQEALHTASAAPALSDAVVLPDSSSNALRSSSSPAGCTPLMESGVCASACSPALTAARKAEPVSLVRQDVGDKRKASRLDDGLPLRKKSRNVTFSERGLAGDFPSSCFENKWPTPMREPLATVAPALSPAGEPSPWSLTKNW